VVDLRTLLFWHRVCSDGPEDIPDPASEATGWSTTATATVSLSRVHPQPATASPHVRDHRVALPHELEAARSHVAALCCSMEELQARLSTAEARLEVVAQAMGEALPVGPRAVAVSGAGDSHASGCHPPGMDVALAQAQRDDARAVPEG
jgi:hypothetical protein